MAEVLDAPLARRWAVSALGALGQVREEIDALNVYPVPDGDTGTNLYLTLEGACAAVLALAATTSIEVVVDSFARGALLGARGNSGIIAAQMLRGWADELAGSRVIDGAAAKRAFRRGDDGAWQAVGRPVEGTMLSVSRAAADAAQAADDDLVAVVRAAAAAAREALARTPDQLEVLRRAGVVDAGGRGVVVLLDTLESVVTGTSTRPPRDGRGHRSPAALPVLDECAPHDGDDGPAYEVMYLLDAEDGAVVTLRARLASLGESLAVVGGGGLWHVHVHADDPGAAIEAGIEAGRPSRVRITHFADAATARERTTPKVAVGLVACAAGPGLAELFEAAGAVVVRSVAGRRPSTGELLDAVHRTHAEAVVVLPNDQDTLSVARAAAEAARQSGMRVSVLPTRAQVAGLAAAAVHDPGRAFDDDLVRMSAAAGSTRDGAVTIAARHAITTAGVCHAGDVLGAVGGDFVVVGKDLVSVAHQVLDRLLSGGGELVTLVRGDGCGDDLVTAVTDRLRRTRRDLEVSVLVGGQPRYPLLVGVE